MKLSVWAREQGVSYWTARRWHIAGDIPGAIQLPSGTRLVVTQSDGNTRRLVGYARVSSADQKDDLVRQADRLKVAGASEVISETGSGLNGNRAKLIKLLKSDCDILVEHRERLSRFGFSYIEAAIFPRRIVVLDPKELEDDLVRDFTELVTCFAARLYGRRGAKNRAARALAAASDE